MYREIITALQQAGQDDSVVTLITGAGQYFCSGNDLNNFLNIPPEGPEKLAADGRELLRSGLNKYKSQKYKYKDHFHIWFYSMKIIENKPYAF